MPNPRSETVPEIGGIHFRHPELARLAKDRYTPEDLQRIEFKLILAKTLDITVDRKTSLDLNGKRHQLALVHATEASEESTGTEMSPKNIWIRDQTLVAKAKMDMWETDRSRYQHEGELSKEILVSTLDIMSTPAQLDRFDSIIDGSKDKDNFHNWPYIFLETAHIDGKEPNNWRHIQDAWQMLAFSTFDAIEKGLLSVDELEDHHKQFLAATVPFLESVNFVNQKNSGSWEELMSLRTSVLGVETGMLAKIRNTALEKNGTVKKGFEFLEEGYEKAQQAKVEPSPYNFGETLNRMVHGGLNEIAKRLPEETPRDLSDHDAEYRGADASLIYLLNFGIPKLLADKYSIKDAGRPLSKFEIEMMILEQINTLKGENGIRRYANDSYQGENWHTKMIQSKIKAIKAEVKQQESEHPDHPEEALIVKFEKRHEAVGEEHPPEWTLFDPQISSYFGIEAYWSSDKAEKAAYEELATEHLNRTLSNITGPEEYHTQQTHGHYGITQAPELRIPECFNYYSYTKNGKKVNRAVASPHLPLNWSVAETHKALAINLSLAKYNAYALAS